MAGSGAGHAVSIEPAATAVHAAVRVDNLLQPHSATTLVQSNVWAAQSFITAGEAVKLQRIEPWLGQTPDGGANWLDYGSLNPCLVRVNVSALPAPASVLTLLAGRALLLALRRRWRV